MDDVGWFAPTPQLRQNPLTYLLLAALNGGECVDYIGAQLQSK